MRSSEPLLAKVAVLSLQGLVSRCCWYYCSLLHSAANISCTVNMCQIFLHLFFFSLISFHLHIFATVSALNTAPHVAQVQSKSIGGLALGMSRRFDWAIQLAHRRKSASAQQENARYASSPVHLWKTLCAQRFLFNSDSSV